MMSVVTANGRDRLHQARERTRAAGRNQGAREGSDAAKQLGDTQAVATCEVRLDAGAG